MEPAPGRRRRRGAAYFYLADPREGPRRRAAVRDRLARLPGLAAGGAPPAPARATSPGTPTRWRGRRRRTPPGTAPTDDAALAQKVRSEVFAAVDVPRGAVNVNAERGVVVLRGQVGTPEVIAALEAATRRVAGVRGVDNRLRLPAGAGRRPGPGPTGDGMTGALRC